MAVALFICVTAVFSLSGRKRICAGLVLFGLFALAFCLFTSRRINVPVTVFSIFPEAFDASLLLEAFHEKGTPWALGRTYLSAILSCVPSAVLEFRETYGFGRFSLQILFDGIAAPTYGGLRPTFVGEAYLNGGIPGVLAIGTLLGAVLGLWQQGTGTLRNLSGAWVAFFLLSLLSVMVSDFYGIFHAYVLVVLAVWIARWLLKRNLREDTL